MQESCLLLENFAQRIGHRFDRQLAQRILYESHLNELSKPHEDWLDTVTSCAEALEFRIRRTEISLLQVVDLVRAGLPTAILRSNPKGMEHWLLITRCHRSKLQYYCFETGQTHWISRAKFVQYANLASMDAVASWLVCYPIMMREASSATAYGDDHDPHHATELTPFARLTRVLHAERSDVSVIAIFSVVVGLLSLTTPIAVEALVNTLAFGQFTQPVLILSLIVFVLLGFSSLLTASSTYAAEIIQRRLFVRLVEDLAYRLPRVQHVAVERSPLPELTSRFLEISTIQKSVSKLLLDGLVIILQTLIGMVVLAFYHPFLLGFDVMLLVLIAFTLFVLGRGAIRTAIVESANKYKVLEWLQEISRYSTAFKLNDGWEFAVLRSDHLASGYLHARKKHFQIVFRQVIFALMIYCLATTVLLGLGGWLVISGELSLGQLVAAELIVILIVRSFAKLGKHMESFYDLMAAVDKVGMLLDLPLESHDKMLELNAREPIAIRLDSVSLNLEGREAISQFTVDIPPGQKFAILGSSETNLSLISGLLLRMREPASGRVLINGVDARDYRMDSIRAAVSLVRDVDIFSGHLDENVHLNRPQISVFEVRQAIEAVGLLEVINRLPDGIHARMESGGFPLSQNQSRRLMLARGIVDNPQFLIVDQTFDAFPLEVVQSLLAAASEKVGTMLVLTERDDIARLFDINAIRI